MARYIFQLTIQYNANGGSGAPSAHSVTDSSVNVPYNVFISLSTVTPTRSGYAFLGWSTSASASTASYSPGAAYGYTFQESETHTTTMYAVWSAQKSTLSLHDGTTAATIDDSTVIDVTRYNSSYTHTISYAFGSASGTIVTKSSSTSITWTIPASLANQIPNATRGTCTLYCTTYSGNTSLGTTSTTISLFVKQSFKRTIGTVSISEGYSSMPSGISVYVQGKSKLTFSIPSVSTNAYGATVASVSTTVNGKTYSGSSFTTDAISTSGAVSYDITLTDSRGRTDTKSGSVTVYSYHAPTPVITNVTRDEDTPTTVLVKYTWNISSVNSQNSKSLNISSKLTTASTYPSGNTLTPGTYSGSSTYTLTGIDAAYPYNIRLTATDKFTTASYMLTLPSSGSRYIECDVSTQTVKFPLNVGIIGNLTVNGSINSLGSITQDAAASTQLANNTWVAKETLTIPKGTWIIEAGCQFTANATGYRAVVLASSSGSNTTYTRGTRDVVAAIDGIAVTASFCLIRQFTAQTVLYLNCYQNSGSALAVYPWYRAMRIL